MKPKHLSAGNPDALLFLVDVVDNGAGVLHWRACPEGFGGIFGSPFVG